MRTYPRNSPQAAGRILALTLLADGSVTSLELKTLERLDAARQLGLTAEEFTRVVQALCEDLLSSTAASWAHSSTVDPLALRDLMADVDDPKLRMRLLQLCVAVAQADNHLANGEAALLEAAHAYWGISREALMASDPAT